MTRDAAGFLGLVSATLDAAQHEDDPVAQVLQEQERIELGQVCCTGLLGALTTLDTAVDVVLLLLVELSRERGESPAELLQDLAIRFARHEAGL